MPRRLGRPGLLGTMARTAVVAGTATATVNAVNSHKASKEEAQQQAAQQQAAQQQAAQQQAAQQQAAPSTGISDDALEQLEKLSALHQSGALTDEEFSAAKARLLGI